MQKINGKPDAMPGHIILCTQRINTPELMQPFDAGSTRKCQEDGGFPGFFWVSNPSQ
jgi:hypothetical protein